MSDLDEIREARLALDAVINEIQAVPGFEDFLAASTFDDISSAAGDRPIVYITPAEDGGLGLIVRGTRVEHVPLAGLSNSELRARVTPYLETYSSYRSDPNARAEDWDAALDAMLEWLWEAVMAAVLDRLEQGIEVVLVAGGLLGLVPLQAAWTEDTTAVTGRRYALDHVVISYAPNARAVSAARKLAASTNTANSLVVVDPQPVSATALNWARAEGAVAAAYAEHATVLDAGKATTAAFRREAQTASLLHLACHGVANLEAPLESGLLLAGNRWITLEDLLGMTLHVRLAVLSACETSLPGTDLPDEVVALPTGLLQAGVAGVIASQWAVPDLGTAILMTDFYRRLPGETPAVALRDAQQWVRDRTNDEKITEWQRALAQADARLPAAAGEALIDQLAFANPDGRDHADVRSWAAFAHMGV